MKPPKKRNTAFSFLNQKPPPIPDAELSHLVLKTFFNSPEYNRDDKDKVREQITKSIAHKLYRLEKTNQQLADENYKQWMEIENLKSKIQNPKSKIK